MVKAPIKLRRELATKNIRIYPSTLELLQILADREDRTIASALHNLLESTSLEYAQKIKKYGTQ